MHKTEIKGEMEFLFAAYSVFKVSGLVVFIKERHRNSLPIVIFLLFLLWMTLTVQVVRVDFSPQDWSKSDARYTVAIEAAMDNDSHDDVPLAPWS